MSACVCRFAVENGIIGHERDSNDSKAIHASDLQPEGFEGKFTAQHPSNVGQVSGVLFST